MEPLSNGPGSPYDRASAAVDERLEHHLALWRGKSLVSLMDVSAAQVLAVLKSASALKALRQAQGVFSPWTGRRTLALLFDKPSLRTRVSFETAMAHLGGHSVYLAPSDVGLGKREPVADIAAGLSRWVDVIAARVFEHEVIEELARNSTVPVINALTDREHPLQAFADLLTLQERFGSLAGVRLAYVGDGNNVLTALLLACVKVGCSISYACPDGYQPDEAYVSEAKRIAAENGCEVLSFQDPGDAVSGAHAVYTDVWTSMGQETEQVQRRHVFRGYQVNADLMALAPPGAIAMHCLPAHRGEEISAEVMDTHHEVIFDQAENRMHTQKALLLLMAGR